LTDLKEREIMKYELWNTESGGMAFMPEATPAVKEKILQYFPEAEVTWECDADAPEDALQQYFDYAGVEAPEPVIADESDL